MAYVLGRKKPNLTYPEQTGSIVTFNSQYAGLPLKSCKVNIPVTQEGTGDPSPDNVRNFVGISSLDFTANSVVRTFQFGQTIYAGELDVLTGIFKATHGVVDLGARTWYRNDDGYFFCEGIPIIKTGYANHTPAPMMCENLKTVAFYISSKGGYFEGQDKAIAYGYNSGDRICVHNTDYTNVSDFTNSMNGIKLVYELATPEVINLGGMNIETLQGENNLFASTGDTTVEYIKIGG